MRQNLDGTNERAPNGRAERSTEPRDREGASGGVEDAGVRRATLRHVQVKAQAHS